jgi:hypothetical protein
LGNDRLEKRIQLFQHRHQKLRALAEAGDSSNQRIADYRHETRREMEGIIPRTDTRKLLSLREGVARDLTKLTDRGDLRHAEALDDVDVPEAIRSGRHNPPFAAYPPFPWSYSTFYHQITSGISAVSNWWLDGAIGKVGARVIYQNDSPGDSDWCYQETPSFVGFWVPAQGAKKNWRFWVSLACGAARGLFRWEDEFGSSFTHNEMWSDILIYVTPGGPPMGGNLSTSFRLWEQVWQGDDDWNFLYEAHPHGWQGTFMHTSPWQVPNQGAFVTIGTIDHTTYTLDDVELDNVMSNRWQILKVAIELV